MTNQLIFEPRRVRRVAGQGAAPWPSAAGVVALVAIGGFWLAWGWSPRPADISMPVGRGRRTSPGTSYAPSALAMGAGLGAFALTMIFRHTVATLALLFVYSIGGEIVVNLLPFEGAGRWSLGNNAFGWLAIRHRYFDVQRDVRARASGAAPMQTMTHLESGTFLGVLLVVAVVVSLLWFSRRDV